MMKKTAALSFLLFLSFFISGCPAEEKKAPVPAPAPVAAVAPNSAPQSDDYAIKTKRPAGASKAIDFSLPGLNGGTINLADYKGKVIIVDFWATWCPPCKAEIPDFITLHNKYGKDGFVMIGVAIDDPDKVKDFVKTKGVNYLICIGNQSTANDYGGIRGIPTTFVIDKEGYVDRQYVGYRPMQTFEQDITDMM
jgi:peroxiredoxin